MKKYFKNPLFIFVVSCTFIIGLIGGYTMTKLHYETTDDESITFTVEKNESVQDIAQKLEQQGWIESPWLFQKYLVWKKIDRKVKPGTFSVEAPVTIPRIARALLSVEVQERTITILPGWNLRDIARYLEAEGYGTESEFYSLVGLPATDMRPLSRQFEMSQFTYLMLQDKPEYVSLEGYLAPDTFRVFADATLEDIVNKLMAHREAQLQELSEDIEQSPYDIHEVLTLASLVEREVRSPEDRAIVADLFMRRLNMDWALQADSTVHYVVDKKGDVFTTSQDRASDNLWNTYKYPGLPPGPIASPSMSAIKAVVQPTENPNWYFLTDFDGNVHYGSTLEEHNRNVQTYLR